MSDSMKDADEKWITVNGTHIKVGEGGKPVSGPPGLKKALSKKNTKKSNSQNRGKNQSASYNSNTAESEQHASSQKNPGGNMTEKELRTALMSSPKENVSGIRRHVMDDAWVKQRDEALEKGKLPRSGLSVSEKKIRSVVSNRLKTGDFETMTARRGDARATMKFSHSIGLAFVLSNKGEIEQQNTKVLRVVYSKSDGYHFFPVPEKE
jgi:hypothetical protein